MKHNKDVITRNKESNSLQIISLQFQTILDFHIKSLSTFRNQIVNKSFDVDNTRTCLQIFRN